MYFASALELTKREQASLKITDDYSLHKLIYNLFDDIRTPEEKAQGKSRGFVFSDRGVTSGGNRRILMLSNRPPAVKSGGRGSLVVKDLPEDFFEKKLYRFQITANTTKTQSGKIVSIHSHDEIKNWLVSRSQAWGFSVVGEVGVNSVDVLKFRAQKNNLVTLCKADLFGVLCVSDPKIFKDSVLLGLGPGKAFGCGLLQILPLK